MLAAFALMAAYLVALPYLHGGAPGDGEVEALSRGAGSPRPVDEPPVQYTRDEGLQQLLVAEAHRVNGRASIHVRVDDGRVAGVNADREVPAASVIKLPLMAAVYAKRREGDLVASEEDDSRIHRMITRSDNPSADALMDEVSIPWVNQWLELQGYPTTRLRRHIFGKNADGTNVITAAEATSMLLRIARGEMVDRASSIAMRQVLLEQERRSRIPAGLPPEVSVGNKTGTLNGLVHDVAFVETPHGVRYALAVLISGARREVAADGSIARISQKVYEYLDPPRTSETTP
jgi:beta-lactamase class A